MKNLKLYYVSMVNGQGCVIASDILYAKDEWTAIDIFKHKNKVIEYDDDHYHVEEIEEE